MPSKGDESRRTTRYMLTNFVLNPFGYLKMRAMPKGTGTEILN